MKNIISFLGLLNGYGNFYHDLLANDLKSEKWYKKYTTKKSKAMKKKNKKHRK